MVLTVVITVLLMLPPTQRTNAEDYPMAPGKHRFEQWVNEELVQKVNDIREWA